MSPRHEEHYRWNANGRKNSSSLFVDDRFSASDGQFADAVAAFLYDDDGPCQKLVSGLVYHGL